MRLEERSLLFDISEACLLILQFTSGKNFAEYSADAVCRSAVERQFITIGEALNRLTKLNPAIPARIPESRAIISFRNILVHGYDRVEDEVVWGIVNHHVAPLRDISNEMLREP